MKKLLLCGGHFDIPAKQKELHELEESTQVNDFWSNRDQANDILKKISNLKKLISSLEKIRNLANNDIELLESGDVDEELLELVKSDLLTLNQSLEEESIFLLLDGPYDSKNCIFDIHSGAGGTEACDWAYMLYRMYVRYFERQGFSYQILDYQDGDEAGIKSASLMVKGDYVYGYLKSEKGVHRLVRLSPFDSNHRRHTSFASVDVTPVFDSIPDIEINDKDLKIDVYRSSGAGGQHVNTTDSAVRITHLPTKIVVTCQNERSQIQNREQAMKILKNKLYLLALEEQQKKIASIQGESKNIEFGSQIRSYVMQPYSMVKDHRTNYETSNVEKVLDGDLSELIESYLKEVR